MDYHTLTISIIIIYLLSGIGLFYGIYIVYSILRINPKDEEKLYSSTRINEDINIFSSKNTVLTNQIKLKIIGASERVNEGTNVHLLKLLISLLIFIVLFSILILLCAEEKIGFFYKTCSFLIGALSSLTCGYFGMKLAVSFSYRTTFKYQFSFSDAFLISYKGCCALGFLVVSINTIVLLNLIVIYKKICLPEDTIDISNYQFLFEVITGYGLGASSVALFYRISSGNFSQTINISSDLYFRKEIESKEHEFKNPLKLSEHVRLFIEDICGNLIDFFAVIAECNCAALLIQTTSPEIIFGDYYLYPLVMTAIYSCLSMLATIIGFMFFHKIMNSYNYSFFISFQIMISTILYIPFFFLVNFYFLPKQFQIGYFGDIIYRSKISNQIISYCSLLGLLGGLLSEIFSYYFTSIKYLPLTKIIKRLKLGPALNTILSFSLGFQSSFFTIILMCFIIFFSLRIAGIYGISSAVIGIIGNIPILLSIRLSNRITHYCKNIMILYNTNEQFRMYFEQLNESSTYSISFGKGFELMSACLVSLSFFGAFTTKTKIIDKNCFNPIVFVGIINGSLIPFVFIALTTKGVRSTTFKIVQELFNIKKKIIEKNRENDVYLEESEECISIISLYSIKYMILPGVLVIFNPIILGILLGPYSICGYILGTIVSTLNICVSNSYTGGASNNIKARVKSKGLLVDKIEELQTIISHLHYLREKKNIEINYFELAAYEDMLGKIEESGNDENINLFFIKGRKDKKFKEQKIAERSSVMGKLLGNHLEYTSDSLRILLRISSILPIIFGSLFVKTGFIFNN